MVDLIFIAGFILNNYLEYCHQTLLVENASYPVTPPPTTVSIVIPAFNEEHFIEHTFHSIQNQNIVLKHPDMFEVIVADNGSTDNTIEIASRYVKVVSSQRGKLYAKHVGVEASSGDIIIFLDADVVLKPNTFNLLLRHFHDPEVVAVGAGTFIISPDPSVNFITNLKHFIGNQVNRVLVTQLYGGMYAVRKNAYWRVGGYDLSVNQFTRGLVGLGKEEEVDFINRLKEIGKVIVDGEATYWSEGRSQWCASHDFNLICNNPYCIYCSEIEKGERQSY